MIDGNEAARLIQEAIEEVRQPVKTAMGKRRRPLKPGSIAMSISADRTSRQIGLYVALDIVERLMKRRSRPTATGAEGDEREESR